jgi:hypothetical protein
MYTDKLILIVNNIINNIPPNSIVSHHKQIHPHLTQIKKSTNFLPNNCKLTERIYCIQHNITTIPLCLICSKPVNFQFFTKGYATYCSLKCINKSINMFNKRKQTFKEKYGVYNASQIKEVKNKKIKTSLKNYGVKHYSQTDIWKKTVTEKWENKSKQEKNQIDIKRQNTIIKKYGIKHYSKTQECKNKIKQTCLKKYGVESHNQHNSVKKKKQETCLNHFGVKHSTQSPEMKEKSKKTLLKRYGVDNPTKSFFFVKKAIASRLKSQGDMFLPNIGLNEKTLLDKQEKIDNCKIDRTFKCLPYHPDGYCHETNTIYEIYEKHHKNQKNYIKDIKRQNYIQKILKCNFVII